MHGAPSQSRPLACVPISPARQAAVEGQLFRGINIERLRDPDVLWSWHPEARAEPELGVVLQARSPHPIGIGPSNGVRAITARY
jgi:hypothetical protein